VDPAESGAVEAFAGDLRAAGWVPSVECAKLRKAAYKTFPGRRGPGRTTGSKALSERGPRSARHTKNERPHLVVRDALGYLVRGDKRRLLKGAPPGRSREGREMDAVGETAKTVGRPTKTKIKNEEEREIRERQKERRE